MVLDPGWPGLLCSCPQYDRRLATGSIQKDKRRGRIPANPRNVSKIRLALIMNDMSLEGFHQRLLPFESGAS